jgi:hypothetical protein
MIRITRRTVAALVATVSLALAALLLASLAAGTVRGASTVTTPTITLTAQATPAVTATVPTPAATSAHLAHVAHAAHLAHVKRHHVRYARPVTVLVDRYPDCEDSDTLPVDPCVTIDDGTWRLVTSYQPYAYTLLTVCVTADEIGSRVVGPLPCVWDTRAAGDGVPTNQARPFLVYSRPID